ncbi:MAG: SIS domain-containing protein [Phycisphaerae bacterium]
MTATGAPRDWHAALAEHTQVLAALASAGDVLDRIVDALLCCRRNRGKLLILGNGGSAADAQHIAAELTGRFKAERPAFPALALTTDTSALTAIGNDLGFERVFARQVEALAARGDALWALSTSGDSPNVLTAVRAARERQVFVVGFTGAGGGALAPLCDLVFRAPHTSSDRIQEAHQLAYHYVCERVEAAIVGGE